MAAVTLSDPVSLDDIARRLGVKPQTPRQWRQRGVMPAPLFVVARVPVWDWPTIEVWARDTNRWHPPADTAPADPASDGNDAARVLLDGRW